MAGIQTMRNLLVVSAALVVALGFVSGNLWRNLRAERQQLADLQDQLTQAQLALASSGQMRVPQPVIQAQAVPTDVVQVPEPRRFFPAPPPPPAAPQSAVSASVRQPLTSGTDQERRADALIQSDRTATARVVAWSSAFRGAQALSLEQLQTLNAVTSAELKRETEDSLEIDSRTGPGSMDAQAAAQLKEETVTRQHETLLRIVEKMKPQLTAEQSKILGDMFDNWGRTHLAAARAEREQAASQGY